MARDNRKYVESVEVKDREDSNVVIDIYAIINGSTYIICVYDISQNKTKKLVNLYLKDDSEIYAVSSYIENQDGKLTPMQVFKEERMPDTETVKDCLEEAKNLI